MSLLIDELWNRVRMIKNWKLSCIQPCGKCTDTSNDVHYEHVYLFEEDFKEKPSQVYWSYFSDWNSVSIGYALESIEKHEFSILHSFKNDDKWLAIDWSSVLSLCLLSVFEWNTNILITSTFLWKKTQFSLRINRISITIMICEKR